MSTRAQRRAGAAAALVLLLPQIAGAWGAGAQRLITNKAVDTLPSDIQPFYESFRNHVVQQSTEPLEWQKKNPVTEQKHRYIFLDRYGRFPFDSLPRDYNTAVRKLGKRSVEQNGLLPWQIGVYSEKLTNAFRARNWEEVKYYSSILAHYVAQAHDPFATTENYDGRLTSQPGVDQRFNTSLVDRFSLFFFVHPNDAVFIQDPTDHAFERCLNSHAWIDHVLLADRRSRRGLSDYTDEYYDRLYNQAGAILLREISDAATDVGSYWLTAWVNAGKPRLPSR
jgi:hypothetical protein